MFRKHSVSALLDAPMLDKIVDSLSIRGFFQWTKHDNVPTRRPYSRENVIKCHLRGLSRGENMPECSFGCLSGGENIRKCALRCPSSRENMIKLTLQPPHSYMWCPFLHLLPLPLKHLKSDPAMQHILCVCSLLFAFYPITH